MDQYSPAPNNRILYIGLAVIGVIVSIVLIATLFIDGARDDRFLSRETDDVYVNETTIMNSVSPFEVSIPTPLAFVFESWPEDKKLYSYLEARDKGGEYTQTDITYTVNLDEIDTESELIRQGLVESGYQVQTTKLNESATWLNASLSDDETIVVVIQPDQTDPSLSLITIIYVS